MPYPTAFKAFRPVRIVRTALLLLPTLLFAFNATAQGDEPATATVLAPNTNAGVTNNIGAGTTCTNGVAHGPYTMTGATPSTLGGMPTCGNYFTLPPSTPNPAADVWFKFTPPHGQMRYRVTLIGSGSPMLTDGAMAFYESPNALGTGPFKLIECARGGSPIAGYASQPSIEASCYSPGSTLYLRVWDEASRPATTKQFHLCVQGQDFTTVPNRGVHGVTGTAFAPLETPCSNPPVINPQAGNTPADYTKIDYVFACNESPWIFADNSEYVGGDLWVRIALNVVPRGTAAFWAYQGASNPANTIGITAYTIGNCSDPRTFQEVGSWSGTLAAAPPLTPLFTLSCLSNATSSNFLYLRIHSVKEAQTNIRRYGQISLRWNRVNPDATPNQANYRPCGATQLSFSGSCPQVGVTPLFGNADVNCSIPGIPDPTCGGFDGTRRSAWYYFTAPASGTVHLEASRAGGFARNPAMALYTTGSNTHNPGCERRFTLLECDDRQGVGDGAAIIRTGLTPGQVYYIRVWIEAPDQQGQFTLCINEPTLPPGHCFYVVDLWASHAYSPPVATTTQGVQYRINGGPWTTVQTPIGQEASQLVLLPVPVGATLDMSYFNSDLGGEWWRHVSQLGDTTRQWLARGGVPVAGPTPAPVLFHTIASTCNEVPAYSNDCLGPKTVCMAGTTFPNIGYNGNVQNAPTPGANYDLNATNMGCLGVEDKGISWLIFKPTQSGTISFFLDGGAVDLDFAIWDTGPVDYTRPPDRISPAICAPKSAPIRCSSARRAGSTGLLPGVQGVTTEGPGGWGWLDPLPVVQDNVYLMAVVRGANSGYASFSLWWSEQLNSSGTPGNILDCTPLILPMELLFLEAEPTQDAVQLTWATASEKNSSHFVVERSTDGSHFTPIGSVQAAGHTQQRTDYLFVDLAPHTGVNYYRLRLVDNDGSTELSNVVAAVFGREEGKLLLFPNPTTTDLFASWMQHGHDDGPLNMRIVDVTGRLVMTRSLPAAGQAERIGTETLPPGVYQVSVIDPTGMTIGNGRFVKQ